MRKLRFPKSQLVASLKEGEAGVAWDGDLPHPPDQPHDLLQVAESIGGTTVAELKRMKELEAENTRPKRLRADLLDNATMAQ